MNRPQRPCSSAFPTPAGPATGRSGSDDNDLRPVSPAIAGLEVADSSFGAWLAAGGDRRQAIAGPRAAWTPEQRAHRALEAQRDARQRVGVVNWDTLRPPSLKR